MSIALKKVSLVSGKTLSWKLDLGVGFNWFDFLGSGGVYGRNDEYSLDDPTYPDLEDTQSWDALRQGLDELKPGFIRFGMPPDPHVGADGAFKSDTVHMAHLRFVNDWASKNGCTIMLDTFTMPHYYEFELEDRKELPGWNMAARDNDEYARNFIAPLFKHIVFEEGMEAVKWFNPINEPMEYGVYRTPEGGPDVMVHYIDMFRAIRQALDEIGIGRNRIALAGMDNTNFQWVAKALQMLRLGADIDPFIDAYNIHYYSPRQDQLQEGTPMNCTIDILTNDIAQYCHDRNKPLFAAEMGTMYYGWREHDPAGSASCDATLTVAEATIRAINKGVGAFAFWCLLNPNTVDGWWRVIHAENGELKCSVYPFHMYGLLSRYARPGSTVFPLRYPRDHSIGFHETSKEVHGTALECENGDKVILLVNNHRAYVQTAHIDLPESWRDCRFEVITTDRVRMMEELAPVESDSKAGLDVKLNPFSLTVFVCPK